MCSFGKVGKFVRGVVSASTSWLHSKNTITVNDKTYKVKKQIGSGGFSSVHLVKDTQSGEEYALKMVTFVDDSEKEVKTFLLF